MAFLSNIGVYDINFYLFLGQSLDEVHSCGFLGTNLKSYEFINKSTILSKWPISLSVIVSYLISVEYH